MYGRHFIISRPLAGDNNQLQQSIYLCDRRNMSQILQQKTFWQSQGHTKVILHLIRYSHNMILKVRARSQHDNIHIHLITNLPTKYQHPNLLQFPRYGQNLILKAKVTTARPNEGYTMSLHTFAPQPMSLPRNNILQLTVSETQPGQNFSDCLPS